MMLNPEKCAFGVQKVLRKRKKFEWDEQGDWVFATIKIYLASFPILNQPHEGERLYIYLAAISVALEKVALVLHTMAKKLKPYFQEHAIVVLMEWPMRVVLHKSKLFGRLVKWAIELGEFEIEYRLQ
ncbi:hypothetical protein CK203_040380 [Vitis vinifera]|uniref:Reverse transcriptase RNase H-like domain-containing protein n=1 Tax=Vitis vinifera TaxID=29760 RepID=A0A438FWY9_VITVI|nr:hypothetical protein CK203_040380 [Vitis vinifera]